MTSRSVKAPCVLYKQHFNIKRPLVGATHSASEAFFFGNNKQCCMPLQQKYSANLLHILILCTISWGLQGALSGTQARCGRRLKEKEERRERGMRAKSGKRKGEGEGGRRGVKGKEEREKKGLEKEREPGLERLQGL